MDVSEELPGIDPEAGSSVEMCLREEQRLSMHDQDRRRQAGDQPDEQIARGYRPAAQLVYLPRTQLVVPGDSRHGAPDAWVRSRSWTVPCGDGVAALCSCDCQSADHHAGERYSSRHRMSPRLGPVDWVAAGINDDGARAIQTRLWRAKSNGGIERTLEVISETDSRGSAAVPRRRAPRRHSTRVAQRLRRGSERSMVCCSELCVMRPPTPRRRLTVESGSRGRDNGRPPTGLDNDLSNPWNTLT